MTKKTKKSITMTVRINARQLAMLDAFADEGLSYAQVVRGLLDVATGFDTLDARVLRGAAPMLENTAHAITGFDYYS